MNTALIESEAKARMKTNLEVSSANVDTNMKVCRSPLQTKVDCTDISFEENFDVYAVLGHALSDASVLNKRKCWVIKLDVSAAQLVQLCNLLSVDSPQSVKVFLLNDENAKTIG